MGHDSLFTFSPPLLSTPTKRRRRRQPATSDTYGFGLPFHHMIALEGTLGVQMFVGGAVALLPPSHQMATNQHDLRYPRESSLRNTFLLLRSGEPIQRGKPHRHRGYFLLLQ